MTDIETGNLLLRTVAHMATDDLDIRVLMLNEITSAGDAEL